MKLFNKAMIPMLILAISLVSGACGPTRSQQLSEAVNESTQAAQSSAAPAPTNKEPDAQTQAQPQPTETLTAPEPTLPPTPTAQPTPVPLDLVLGQDISFVQDGREVLPVFTIENPNESYAYEDNSFQIAVYDKAGTVIETDSTSINMIMPGDKMYYTSSIYLSEGQKADRVDVQFDSGDPTWIDNPISPFTIDKPLFVADKLFPSATAILKNSLRHYITDVRVSAIGFDDAGSVVAAGYTYVNFIPGGESTGIDVSMKTSGVPTRVELYPALSNLSDIQAPEDRAQTLETVKNGYGVDGSTVGIGTIVKNTDTKNGVEGSLYRATVYNSQGDVVSTNEGNINVILPGETLGFYDETFLPDNQDADQVIIQIMPGDSTPASFSGSIFTTDQVEFLPDRNFPKASGVLINGLSKDINDIRLSAIAYDKSDNIIGGGFTYIDFLPGGGKTGVDVSLKTSGAPERLELYPTLSNLSALENANAPTSPIQLAAQGYAQDDTHLGVAFLVTNSDKQNAFGGTQYQVAAYDDQGKVLSTDSGYIDTIFPGETTAGFSDLYLPDGTKVNKVVIQLNPGDPTPAPLETFPFSTDKASFSPDKYFPKATGIVNNETSTKITSVKVIAVAYDEAGSIIGGGYTYMDFVPANEQGAVEMSVVVSGTLAKIELYPQLTSLSDIGQ